MLKHYLNTALRHFRQYKATTAINVVCLAIGLGCFLAAHWLVTSTRSSDMYFPNADRIFVITQKIAAPGSGIGVERPVTGWIAADFLKPDFPELEAIARVSDGVESGEDEVPVSAGTAKAFIHIRYADPAFLNIFALPFIEGDSKLALQQPRSAVITTDTAVRLFGSKTAAMGRTILIQNRYETVVSGVIDTIRSPSHMEAGANYQFDLLVSMDVYEARAHDNARRKMALKEWNFTDVLTYVMLPRGGSLSPELLKARLIAFGDRHVPAQNGARTEFGLMPISGLFMDTTVGTNNAGISIKGVLYLLACIVLLISCFNYANLATAQAATRTKEIGLRRIVGASRRQLMMQHLFESGVQTLVSMLVAAIVCAIALVVLRPSGLGFMLATAFGSPIFWIVLVALWLAVTIAAGTYPAFVLSHVRPVQALRDGRIKGGSGMLTSMLVGSQFVAAGFLLTVVLVMSKQNAAMTRSALADMADPVVILRNNLQDAGVEFERLRMELARQPHIQSVTGSAIAPWSTGVSQAGIAKVAEQGANMTTVNYYVVNHDFFSTLNIKLLAGRAFDRSHADDFTNTATNETGLRNIIVDRAGAEGWGWRDAKDAIGKIVYQPAAAGRPASPLQIVGVVESKTLTLGGNSASMFVLNPEQAFIPSIRISSSDVPAALAEIDSVWNQLAPNVPMKRQFADEVWDSVYRYLDILTGGFAGIAALAIANSLLGLIGVSMLTIARRTREIGVRKTLGASVASVLTMLMKDAAKPVVIGNLIAWPLAFLAMRVYLSLFPHRTVLSPLPFMTSLAITVFVAWLAVVVQATRAARLNPAKVLRSE